MNLHQSGTKVNEQERTSYKPVGERQYTPIGEKSYDTNGEWLKAVLPERDEGEDWRTMGLR